MATTVLLIRHAVHDVIDRILVGRSSHGLSARGREQADSLARRLAHLPISCLQSSPQVRAQETACAIGAALRIPVTLAPALDEIDVGTWRGLPFDELASDPLWRRWNAERGAVTPPGGESMRAVQRRTVDYIAALATTHPDEWIALVSHAEPIRTAIMHARAIPLDDFLAIRIDPASVTILRIERGEWILSNENTPVAA